MRYLFFEKFGKRHLDQIHLGNYDVISRRGWRFFGHVFWHDADWS